MYRNVERVILLLNAIRLYVAVTKIIWSLLKKKYKNLIFIINIIEINVIISMFLYKNVENTKFFE